MDPVEQELRKMLDFDVEKLARTDDFGQTGFQDSVPVARKLQDFYRMLPIAAIAEFPDHFKNLLHERLQSDLAHFQEVMSHPKDQHRNAQRVTELKDRFIKNFNTTLERLSHVFSFAVLKIGDVNRLEVEGRAKIDDIAKRVADAAQQIDDRTREVEEVLAHAKEAAGLTAVSTQAKFFQDEADKHASKAVWWMVTTFIMALAIIIAAGATLALHKIPALEPKTTLDGYQLIASKALLFAILSYVLVLCARNSMSHKHNAVVNKHRQNALLTFKALVDASTEDKIKDVILTHASACIFSPQDTGYIKATGASSALDNKTVIGLLSGAAKGSE